MHAFKSTVFEIIEYTYVVMGEVKVSIVQNRAWKCVLDAAVLKLVKAFDEVTVKGAGGFDFHGQALACSTYDQIDFVAV